MLAAVMSSRDCFMVSSATAAWASKLSGFSAWAFTNNMPLIGWDLNARFARFFPDFMLYEGELSLPWQIIFYLAVGPVVMVGVSLFTKPQAKKKLDRVYVCLRTPVLPGEPEVEPLTLPGGDKSASTNSSRKASGFRDHETYSCSRRGLSCKLLGSRIIDSSFI